MNDVTRVLATWLNSDMGVWLNIVIEVTSWEELQAYVSAYLCEPKDTELARGILGDLLNLVDWRQLYSDILGD